MKKLTWLAPLFFGLGFLYATQAKTVDRILVQVNDDIITQSELNREMEQVRREMAARYTGDQLEQMVRQAEKATLEGLINQKLLYQKAMELEMDDSHVDSRVASIIQQIMKEYQIKDTETLEAQLEQQGSSLRELRENLRKRTIVEDLIGAFVGSRITLLTPEIEKYYKDHQSDFATPEEVTLSELIVSEGNDTASLERANALYQRLQKGESFPTLATQYSKGRTASKGGASGTYLVSKLNAATVKAIAGLKEGEISTPQKVSEGYIIYRIDAHKEASVRPFEEVKDEIKNRLYEKKFNPELERFITQLKEDAYIQIFSEIK